VSNETNSQSEIDLSGTPLSAVGERFKGDSSPNNGIWTSEAHAETSVERSVRRTLYRIYFVGGIFAAACVLLLFFIGLTVYHRATYVDPVNPDYSSLDTESDTYWTDRIQFDIQTAQQSAGTDQIRLQRLRRFVYRTVTEALIIPSPYARALAVTSIAVALAQQDINIILDSQLRQLGDTPLIMAMRARALVSQALMHIRLRQNPAAQTAMRQYRQLVIDADLKLNSTLNEESFFGAVTVLKYLNDEEGLTELFNRQRASTAILGIDQQMKAYRLIAGEQVRIGKTAAALETVKQINNPVELSRALALILQYTARPPNILPIEPTMFDLLVDPPTNPPRYPFPAEQVTHEIFRYLADNKDINTQTALLLRIAGSRLMCDRELYQIFRRCLMDSTVFDDRVKQPVLKLLNDPESSVIRAALDMPPRTAATPQFDTAVDDWTTSDESIFVETVDIDPTPLRTRNDQQWIHALFAIAQSYQSVKRFQDADRVLKQAFVAAQRFEDPTIRIQLLLRIGERQVAIGSIADAKRTFAVIAPMLNQDQKSELARLQIIGRLFDDAQATISSIELPAMREYVGSFLVQEQIRIHRLHDAEKTLALMPQGSAATVCRSRLNVAKEQANREDFKTLRLTIPEGNTPNWERYCIELIQQGFLHLADQAADGISDVQKRTNIQTRLGREYLLLNQAFNDTNDPTRTIRREMQQAIGSLASRTSPPVIQTTIRTELLMYLTGQLQTEEDRADGKQLWSQAIDSCRRITKLNDKVGLFAQLIVIKNFLEVPNLQRRAKPLFTKETNPSAFAETDRLVKECLELLNLLDNEAQQSSACVHLARALAQVGRTKSAQMLLDRVLDSTTHLSDYTQSVSLLLSMIPALKATNSAETIPMIYRLAINVVIGEFSGKSAQVDLYAWRMRDSEIEQIIRSQMENGFVDDAVESATRLNEPVLRDRLLRTAAYIYLDQGDVARAELEAQRLTVKEIQSSVVQNIQVIQRRSVLSTPDP